jgi:GDYXXLXY motif protein
VLLIQAGLTLGTVGKYWYDRAVLPQVWVATRPVDPESPLRGRYVALRIEALDRRDPGDTGQRDFVALGVEGDRLAAASSDPVHGVLLWRAMPDDTSGPVGGRTVTLAPTLAFYIPAGVEDPTVRAPGETLWVRVSVPPEGLPRPVALGVRRGGAIVPLHFR